jgi:hypothetical protein
MGMKDLEVFLEDIELSYLLENSSPEELLKTLQRKLHTAPPNEKNIIRNTIKNLENKLKNEKSGGYVNVYGKKVYPNWGRGSEYDTVTPDTWYDTREEDSYTFFYIIDKKELHYTAGDESHWDFMDEVEQDTGETLYPEMEERDLADFTKVMEGSENVISGRTGTFEGDEDIDIPEYVVSIWTEGIKKDNLVDLLSALEDKLGFEYNILFIPDRKVK